MCYYYLCLGIDSREGYGLETHVTHVIILPSMSVLNAACFDLICVISYGSKITGMRYLCGTVAIIPGNLRAS